MFQIVNHVVEKKKHTHIEIYYGKMVFVFRFENHFSLYIVYTTQWEVLE